VKILARRFPIGGMLVEGVNALANRFRLRTGGIDRGKDFLSSSSRGSLLTPARLISVVQYCAACSGSPETETRA
jgi:hypothetical protein